MRLCQPFKPNSTPLFTDVFDEAPALLASMSEAIGESKQKIKIKIQIYPDHTRIIWNKLYQMCLIGTQDHGTSISWDHFLMTFDWLSGISWVKLALLQKQRVSELKMEGNILCIAFVASVYFPIPKLA